MNKNNEAIQISSFYLSAFLLAKGIPLIGVSKLTSNKLAFMFPHSDETKNFVRSFNFAMDGDPDLLVDFKKTEASIKKLKSLIYD